MGTQPVSTVKAWLRAHSITSQSIASAWIFFTVLYNTNPEFKSYCQSAYAMIPHGLHSFLVGFLVPVAIFWRSTHTTKVSAEIEDGAPGAAMAEVVTQSAPISAPPKE